MEKVADGVWLLRGDTRKAMNIYFLEDGDGVVQFDAGTKAMVNKARAAAIQLGGLKRVVLGHAHPDHRACAALTQGAWLAGGRRFALYYYEVDLGSDTQCFRPMLQSPPIWKSRRCRRRRAGSTRCCCGAGTAAR